jgi:hypothetical protein
MALGLGWSGTPPKERGGMRVGVLTDEELADAKGFTNERF